MRLETALNRVCFGPYRDSHFEAHSAPWLKRKCRRRERRFAGRELLGELIAAGECIGDLEDYLSDDEYDILYACYEAYEEEMREANADDEYDEHEDERERDNYEWRDYF